MADNPSAEPDSSVATRPGSLLALRLAIGLVQGLIAWQLLDMLPRTQFPPAEDMLRSWPYRNPGLFAILAMIISFVPVVALAQAGRIRKRRLVLYLVTLAAVLAGLGAYDIWRDPFDSGWGTQTIRIWPSTTLIFCTATGLFIANQLLEHREGGNSLWSAYADHFEDSWMRGFQFVVALVFTALVWGVLELGRSMFDLIHLDGFGHMLEHNWFRCPALAMAFAGSVHITDVRPTLLHGMRNLGLTLLSWLLPLIVALGWSFLLALPFTGLAPLWGTGFAAAILLWAVAVTLVLVNAAYKDGQGTPPLAIRWAGRGAMPMMLILTLLAAYAIGLRVWQYGWTPMRLRSAMVAVIALVYAAGYSRAAVGKAPGFGDRTGEHHRQPGNPDGAGAQADASGRSGTRVCQQPGQTIDDRATGPGKIRLPVPAFRRWSLWHECLDRHDAQRQRGCRLTRASGPDSQNPLLFGRRPGARSHADRSAADPCRDPSTGRHAAR
jgi:hypothetical protein